MAAETAVTGAPPARPAALSNAAVRSNLACPAAVSAAWMAPLVTTPGGNPVTEVPGLSPRSPEMIVGSGRWWRRWAIGARGRRRTAGPRDPAAGRRRQRFR